MSLSSNIARKIKADRLNGIAESVWLVTIYKLDSYDKFHRI